VKTAAAATLGGVLLIAGICLLVLPGPGFVLIAAGLALLATRFDWAKKPLDYAKDKAQQGVDEVARSRWRAVLAAACALGLLALGVLELTGIDVPFVTTLSAILLVISGLFLLGTVVYARRKGAATTSDTSSATRQDA